MRARISRNYAQSVIGHDPVFAVLSDPDKLVPGRLGHMINDCCGGGVFADVPYEAEATAGACIAYNKRVADEGRCNVITCVASGRTWFRTSVDVPAGTELLSVYTAPYWLEDHYTDTQGLDNTRLMTVAMLQHDGFVVNSVVTLAPFFEACDDGQ